MACNNFAPAKMDKRVAIQSVVQTPDGQGGFTEAWVTDATVWASIEPKKAYERMQMGQVMTPITHKIKMRYRTAVSNKQRLLYGSRIFNIKEVINLEEQNTFLEIQAIEQA